MTITNLEILKKMREYISKGWTQKTIARKYDGEECYWSDSEACSYCIQGALYKVIDIDPSNTIDMRKMSEINDILFKTYTTKISKISSKSIINNMDINDYLISSQEEVIAWIDLTISNLEKEELLK